MGQVGGPIKKYYNDLQGLWRDMNFYWSSPIKCAIDVDRYNSLIQEKRVYIFLNGLNDRLNKIRSDTLQMKPFPTMKEAYTYIQHENSSQSIMLIGRDNTIGSIMTFKGAKSRPIILAQINVLTEEDGYTYCRNKHISMILVSNYMISKMTEGVQRTKSID